MKNKILAVLSAAVITAGTIGGVVFASNIDDGIKAKQPITVQETNTTPNPTAVQRADIKTTDAANTNTTNYNQNSVNNPSKDRYESMIKIMSDNGFKDAAKYMQTGNYRAMTNYMENLTQEDFDKMIEIMNDNGYGYMAQMMQSLGRDGMVQMHNSMGAVRGGNYSGMMGGF